MLCSVMQVFLTIARKAEVEAAAQEGRSSETVYLPGGALLNVPLGEEYATVEGSAEQYHVKWAQDESGSLQVFTAPCDLLPCYHAAAFVVLEACSCKTQVYWFT